MTPPSRRRPARLRIRWAPPSRFARPAKRGAGNPASLHLVASGKPVTRHQGGRRSRTLLARWTTAISVVLSYIRAYYAQGPAAHSGLVRTNSTAGTGWLSFDLHGRATRAAVMARLGIPESSV